MPTARKLRLVFLAVGRTSEFRHLLFKLFGRDSKLAVEHLNPEAKRDIRSCGVAVADFNNDGETKTVEIEVDSALLEKGYQVVAKTYKSK